MKPAVVPDFLGQSTDKMEKELQTKYSDTQLERIRRGINQVAIYWRKEDGDAAAFEDFVRINFAEIQLRSMKLSNGWK